MDPFAPEEWAALERGFYARQSVIRAESTSPADRFAGLWADWWISAMVRFTTASDERDRFRLLVRGRTVASHVYCDREGRFREEAFRQLQREGASLAAGNFENHSNVVLELTRELESRLHCPVQANLYVTPPGAQGLGSHVDPHDVLVLQLSGAKTWDVYEGPGVDDRFRTHVLSAGRWLFLPKGIRHEVRNRGAEESIHLTVGFHPLTWGEVLHQALQKGRVADPRLNAMIPPDPADVALDPAAVHDQLDALVPWINVAAHRQRYYGRFPGLRMTLPADQIVAPAELAAIVPESRLSWNPAASVDESDNRLRIQLPYRRTPLELRREFQSLVARIEKTRTFVVEDVVANFPDALLFCRFLAGNGVLRRVT